MLLTGFRMDELLNPQIEELQESTVNPEYAKLPKSIRENMTEKEWLWYPDKQSLVDDMTLPEVEED